MFGRWPGHESVSTATKENIDFKKFFPCVLSIKKRESWTQTYVRNCFTLSAQDLMLFEKENNWLIYRLPLLLIGLGTSPAKPASGDLERATWDPVFCNVNRCTVVITSGVCLIVGSC